MPESVPVPLHPWSAESVQTSKAFCMMPWVHLHVTQLGTVTRCCQAPWSEDQSFGDINTQSIDEIWTGERIRRFRSALLRDEPDARCARCYEKESTGVTSLRRVTNDDYAHRLDWVNQTETDGTCPSSRPIYLDIRFSNVCNFRCRICGPGSSSRWLDDAKALGIVDAGTQSFTRAAEDFPLLMSELDRLADGLEEIYFAGGEPLVMDEHYALLDLLIAKGRTNVRLKYNTNFSHLTFKGKDVLSYWSQFPNVMVSASLDGAHKRGEFQRKEQIWSETVANARRLRATCPHVRFQLSPTVSVFSLLTLPDLHREWVEAGLVDVVNCWPSILIQPEAYNIRILPEPLKLQARETYTKHFEWIGSQHTAFPNDRERSLVFWRSVIAHLDSGDHSRLIPDFAAKCRAIDELRGESTAATFPELAELFHLASTPAR